MNSGLHPRQGRFRRGRLRDRGRHGPRASRSRPASRATRTSRSSRASPPASRSSSAAIARSAATSKDGAKVTVGGGESRSDRGRARADCPGGARPARRHQDLRDGRDRGARAARRLVRRGGQRIRRHHGTVGLGQVDDDEPDRLPRRADLGPLPARRRVDVSGPRRRPAGRDPQPEDRLRLPDLQPAPARRRLPERRAAAGLRRHAPRRSADASPKRRSNGSVWPTACGTGRTSSRAASASASPSPAPWSTTRRSSSPTSRPATSTARTGEEIIDVFDQLHAGGNTIILVTHEDEVARRGAPDRPPARRR